MHNRTRKTVAALLAAGLLAFASMSTASAHWPGFGGGGPGGGHGNPGHSGKVVPVKTTPVKPGKGVKDPIKTPTKSADWFKLLNCANPTPTPSASALPTAVPVVITNKGKTFKLNIPGFKTDAFTQIGSVPSMFKGEWAELFCSMANLQKSADKQITREVSFLNGLSGQVGKDTALSSGDASTLTGELGSLVSDLNALKTKIDGETTLAGVQADFVTLVADFKSDRAVSSWIKLILGVDKVTTTGKALDQQEITLAAQFAAAGPGPESAEIQALLTDLSTNSAAAQALVAPLHAQLLALNPADVASGAAKVTIQPLQITFFQAWWDLSKARHDAKEIQHELAEQAAASASPSPAPTTAPTAAPTEAPTEAPTASPTV
jgi:hypothetical protein